MFYFTDVKYNYQNNQWYWNLSGEQVDEFSWDNKNEIDAFYPYTQDAAAYIIFLNGTRFRLFVRPFFTI